jgi:hypothetical protein
MTGDDIYNFQCDLRTKHQSSASNSIPHETQLCKNIKIMNQKPSWFALFDIVRLSVMNLFLQSESSKHYVSRFCRCHVNALDKLSDLSPGKRILRYEKSPSLQYFCSERNSSVGTSTVLVFAWYFLMLLFHSSRGNNFFFRVCHFEPRECIQTKKTTAQKCSLESYFLRSFQL